MKKAIKFNPFLVFSTQLNGQFELASKSENPALYLYKNGARNIIFMLEGLTRIHKNAFENPKMEKWYDRFKTLEDLLGQIDYYDAFRTQFEANKTLDKGEINVLNSKFNSVINELNTLLNTDNWIDKKIIKFNEFIEENSFKYDAKYNAAIVKAYQKEIKKITLIATELNFNFKEIETQLHELRRRLRWLSIYPQAFNGLFQFEKPTVNPAWSDKYMTEQTVNSPFNKLPQAVENQLIIYLNYPNFIALSFIIQDFGKLKDKGLAEELLATEFNKSETVIKKLLGDKYLDKKTILSNASLLLKTFFEDKVLNDLISNF